MLFRNIKMTYNWTPCVSVSIGPDCQGCQPQKGESLPISRRSFPRPEWCLPANGERRLSPARSPDVPGGAGGAALRLRSQEQRALREGSVAFSAQRNKEKSESLALLSLSLFSTLLLNWNSAEMPPTCVSLQGSQGASRSHAPRVSWRSRWSEFTPCCAQELLAAQTAAGKHTLTGTATASRTSISTAFSQPSKHAAGCPRRVGCFFNQHYPWLVLDLASLPPDSECFHEQQLYVWTSEHTAQCILQLSHQDLPCAEVQISDLGTNHWNCQNFQKTSDLDKI